MGVVLSRNLYMSPTWTSKMLKLSSNGEWCTARDGGGVTGAGGALGGGSCPDFVPFLGKLKPF